MGTGTRSPVTTSSHRSSDCIRVAANAFHRGSNNRVYTSKSSPQIREKDRRGRCDRLHVLVE